mmetsp:Transcript_6028/g.16897  ORF Transcript_6028/g.16897 Transcript_6028/m.16897 type:complete len:253 (+) Transcript_6028:1199-1957(+)
MDQLVLCWVQRPGIRMHVTHGAGVPHYKHSACVLLVTDDGPQLAISTIFASVVPTWTSANSISTASVYPAASAYRARSKTSMTAIVAVIGLLLLWWRWHDRGQTGLQKTHELVHFQQTVTFGRLWPKVGHEAVNLFWRQGQHCLQRQLYLASGGQSAAVERDGRSPCFRVVHEVRQRLAPSERGAALRTTSRPYAPQTRQMKIVRARAPAVLVHTHTQLLVGQGLQTWSTPFWFRRHRNYVLAWHERGLHHP